MRGQQAEFVAGGSAAFMRLRKVSTHPGAQLEVWGVDRALSQNPGYPTNPEFIGMVGKKELLDVAVACLHMLGQSVIAQDLQFEMSEEAKEIEREYA